MMGIEKSVQFGTLQEAILAPKEGYEVDTVEVLNRTTNEVVPSQLTKTSDNPPRWVCSFRQPAGVVVIKPKMKPILYSVIIEECDNCCIVLMESNDVVEVMAAADTSVQAVEAEDVQGAHKDDEPPFHEEADGTQQPPQEMIEFDPEAELDELDFDEAEVIPDDTEGEDLDEGAEGNTYLSEIGDEEEEGQADDATELTQDEAQDTGKFQKEVEEVAPIVMTQAEYDKKCASYWQHRHAFDAGKISREDFEAVRRKYMKLSEDITSGAVIIAKG